MQPPPEPDAPRLSRRNLLVAAESSIVAAAAGALVQGAAPSQAAVALSRVDSLPTGITRTWLGPQYWANRVGDWRLANGRIEALTANTGGRTVGVLTRQIVAGNTEGALSVRTGTLATGTGSSGFLIGAGRGTLDWRAAALVMAASGQGGGLLATYDNDGRVRFRDHSNETNQFTFAELPATNRSGPAPARTLNEDVTLLLEIVPNGSGAFNLTLTARRTSDSTLLSQATRAGVAASDILGGISLISTARASSTTARYWFRDLQSGGSKIGVFARETGPVLGTLYSLAGSVLKLSAQFMPIGTADPQSASLQTRATPADPWTTVASAPVAAGYVALFRIADWDSSQDWEYRVTWAAGTPQAASYSGVVRRNPEDVSSITVAMVNCTIHTFRRLDSKSSGTPKFPGETFRGLYTTQNMYFPYAELVDHIQSHSPDLFVAFGDQYYENRPTLGSLTTNILDVSSRYYLWLWSFGEITRNTPTICLVDDHDVLHPNLFGWSGMPASGGDYNLGGYLMPGDWVNAVQRMQCSHNPDAYDPTPVLQGITVSYGAFSWGGVSFAFLEDRKFKNTNKTNRDAQGNPLPPPRDILGLRQETFLQAWASMHQGQPKVCLTQTIFSTVTTNPSGSRQADPDTSSSPVAARRSALTLLKNARALVLSGDQHLATVVRHGISTFTDGPVQFTGPAAGTAWQRWFTPSSTLPNSNGPNTGDFTDGYGNRFRVLAVANPKISFQQVRNVQPGGNEVGDRALKSEGYGIVRIDKANQQHRLEAWPWQTDPTAPGATQYAGWPLSIPFSQV
jgi:alkaline phosphatase D